jgi:hypothetical protein
VRKKIEEDEMRSKRDSYDDANKALISNINQENNRFIKDQKVQIQKSIHDQDRAIEQLGTQVDKLGEIGRTINTEVKEQTILLDKLETEIDDASTRMGQVEQALGKLLKTKDSCQIWTIVILALILIILGKHFFAFHYDIYMPLTFFCIFLSCPCYLDIEVTDYFSNKQPFFFSISLYYFIVCDMLDNSTRWCHKYYNL